MTAVPTQKNEYITKWAFKNVLDYANILDWTFQDINNPLTLCEIIKNRILDIYSCNVPIKAINAPLRSGSIK